MNTLHYFGVFMCVALLHNGHSWANEEDILLLIEDWLRFYKFAQKIYTHVCWEKELQLRLPKFALQAKYHEFPSAESQVVLLMDMSCKGADFFLENMQKRKLLSPRFILLLINATALTSHYFPVNSNAFFLKPLDEGFSFNKIYSGDSNATIGTWTKAHRYIEGPIAKGNVRGTNLKVSFALNEVVVSEQCSHLMAEATTKLNFVLLEDVLRMINSTSVINKSSELELVNDLITGKCDIGGTPLTLTAEKLIYLDVLAKTFREDKKFIFRAAPHSYIGNVFTLPFDSYVWCSCIGLMMVIFLIVYIVVCWEWKDPVFKLNLEPSISLRPNPVDILLMEVGSAAQQGFEAEPRSNSGRIVFISTLISFMFLYTSFSASIVALLQSTTDSLNTFDSLFQSRIDVGFEQNISMDFFNDVKHQSNIADHHSKLRNPQFLTLEEGVKRLQNDFFAFYAETSEVYHHINRWFQESEKCSLREIAFKNTHISHWLFMRKNSEYKDLLRMGMSSIQERGIRSREFKRLFPLKPFCDSIGGNFESVGLVDSYGAFLIMIYGVALSLILFLLEQMSLRYNLSSRAQSIRNRIFNVTQRDD